MIRHARKLSALAAIGIATMVAAPAQAATTSISLGPIPVPNVPITVCVNSGCTTVPAVNSVSMNLSASTNGLGLPVIVPISCPSGTVGVGAQITSVGGSAEISGDVTGTTSTGTFDIPIGPLTVPPVPGGSVTVSACTS